MHTATESTGAHVIVETLWKLGSRRIYLFPGGTIAPILDVAVTRNMELVVSRHEQAAGFMAMAEARLTRAPAVVAATSGPGATNLLTAVADAYFDSCPLIVLTGQVSTPDLARPLSLRQRGFQECRTAEIYASVTKAVFEPTDTVNIQQIVMDAWSIASSGRPGPVLIDLPMDVQRAHATVSRLSSPENEKNTQSRASSRPNFKALFRTCKRPLLLVGHGVMSSGKALAHLRQLTEENRVPSVTSIRALGAISHSCPTHLGFLGHTGFSSAGKVIQDADLLLVIGSRLDVRQTGTEVKDFGRNARILRFDIDVSELQNARIEHSENYNLSAEIALEYILDAVNDAGDHHFDEWVEHCVSRRREDPLWIKFQHSEPSESAVSAMDPETIVALIGRTTLENPLTHFVTGVGSHQQWAARMLPHDVRKNRWHSSTGHGTMGFDIPSSNGLRLADPESKIICLVGDGSLLMNIQELAVTRELGGPTAIIVIDNGRFGIVSQFQRHTFGRDPSGQLPREDFVAIAEAFGVRARRVDDWSGVEQMCLELPHLTEPVLFQVVVDADADVSPMLMGGQKLDAMWSR